MPASAAPDSFTYTVSDGNGGTDTATVDVTVEPVVVGCELDELDIALSGSVSGGYSGCINSGDLTVKTDTRGIRSVKGTAHVPSVSGGAGESVVTFNLERIWILPFYTGKVKVVDADSGINVTAHAFFSRIDGSGSVASGKLTGFTGKWWAPKSFTLTFEVNDLA
ncbi:MAG: hypothetical protein M5U19_06370 [Microthrixaceae bacterium]|nr:hypothetical protein [Microthrixaceae bacterium]